MILLTIASREMAERKLVWAAAALVGLAGAVLPWMNRLTGLNPGETMMVPVSFIFGFVLTLAAVLGAAMIPSDLANRRMGFYLARPVPIATLLGGRFLGAWLLASGGAALVALFQVALHPREVGQWTEVTGLAALVALPVLLLFHYLGMLWRARSPWVLLDLSAMSGFLWLMAWMVGRLVAAGAWDAVPWLMGGAATTVPLVLAAAAFFQMERGRADLRRGHRAMSMTVAAGLLAVVLAGLAFLGWVRGWGPSTLATFRVAALAPKGDWLYLAGTGRMHPQAFLLNSATGEALAVPTYGRFSGDGRHYVRAEVEPGSSLGDVVDVDLGAVPARERTRVSLPLGEAWGLFWVWNVSEDGRFALLRDGRSFLVVDLASGRKVCQEALPAVFGDLRFCFPSADVLRGSRPLEAGGTEIRDLDLAHGHWTVVGRIQEKGVVRQLGTSVLVADGDGYTVFQGRTGARTGSLHPAPGGSFDGVPRPRGDGSFAVVERRGEEALLRILDGAGGEVWAEPLPGPPGTRFSLHPERGSGRVFVNALPAQGAPEALEARLLVADPSRHALAVMSERGQLPMGNRDFEDAQLATRLLLERDGGLSVATPGGAFRPLLGKARCGSPK